jgi:hypothetical protein
MATSDPGSGSTKCPNAPQGTSSFKDGAVISANLNVPAGVDCRLGSVEVQGNVSATGNLYTFGKTQFDKNVTVNPGGSFNGSNWPVTINGDLRITDPAAGSGNGFWGSYTNDDQCHDHPWMHLNEVKGSLIYTIDQNYPQYNSPYLYFGGGTKVDGDFTYSTGGRMTQSPGDGLIAAPAAVDSLITLGNTTIS